MRKFNIEFDRQLVADTQRLNELIRNSPEQSRQAIYDFASYIKKSMAMAIALILLITLFGAVLMYYRKNG